MKSPSHNVFKILTNILKYSNRKKFFKWNTSLQANSLIENKCIYQLIIAFPIPIVPNSFRIIIGNLNSKESSVCYNVFDITTQCRTKKINGNENVSLSKCTKGVSLINITAINF